jgi:hypothetical protein
MFLLYYAGEFLSATEGLGGREDGSPLAGVKFC